MVREMVALTKSAVAALKMGPQRRDVWAKGFPGLCITLRPPASRVWYFVARVGGEVIRHRIGAAEKFTPDEAKRHAEILRGKVAQGCNPAAERREGKAQPTLEDLWLLFLTRHAKVRKRSWGTDEKRWNLHLSKLGKRKADSISRAEVVRFLDGIARAAGPGQANRVRALAHTIYQKARQWGYEFENPFQGSPRNPERKRERYLGPAEVRALVRAARADRDPDARDTVLLLLFTGVRIMTLLGARVEEFDLRERLWRIPSERMKAGRPLLLPVAPASAEIVAARIAAGNQGFLFPSERRAEGFIAPPREGLIRIFEAAGFALPGQEVKRRKDRRAAITPHTLRHTYATWSGAVGVPALVIGDALGHTRPGGVTADYTHTPVELVRAGVEVTVAAMLKAAETPDQEGAILKFPTPVWVLGALGGGGT